MQHLVRSDQFEAVPPVAESVHLALALGGRGLDQQNEGSVDFVKHLKGRDLFLGKIREQNMAMGFQQKKGMKLKGDSFASHAKSGGKHFPAIIEAETHPSRS